MTPGERIAYQAGFRKSGEIMTSTDPRKVGEFSGMDILSEPLMPEGWFALRTDEGALCVGPKGSFWVPAFDPDEIVKRKFTIYE